MSFGSTLFGICLMIASHSAGAIHDGGVRLRSGSAQVF
jgi:hypothetical protein